METIKICRYCWSDENQPDLIKPCECSSYVHRECLKRWYSIRHMELCEICHTELKVAYSYKVVCKNTQTFNVTVGVFLLFLIYGLLLTIMTLNYNLLYNTSIIVWIIIFNIFTLILVIILCMDIWRIEKTIR